jgi:hypothetical protein
MPLFRDNRDSTFPLVQSDLLPIWMRMPTWGDYDNDGWPDLVLAGNTVSSQVRTRLMHNDADGTFTTIDPGFPGIFAGLGAWGDFNNDGRLDLVLTATGANSFNPYRALYRNIFPATNTVPTAPSQLAQGCPHSPLRARPHSLSPQWGEGRGEG